MCALLSHFNRLIHKYFKYLELSYAKIVLNTVGTAPNTRGDTMMYMIKDKLMLLYKYHGNPIIMGICGSDN